MPAKKRYVVHTGLTYPLNPKAPRDEWELVEVAAGEVVDTIPAVSVDWLLEQGLISEAGRDKTPLPDDFPGRVALADAGIQTYGDVVKRFDELLDVKGIGEKTHEDIRLALIEHNGEEEEPDGA